MMRFLSSCLVLPLAFAAIHTVDDPFAALHPVEPQLAPAARSIFNFFRASSPVEPSVQVLRNRHSVRLQPRSEEEPCDFYPEIVLVQDVTQSFADDMVNLKRLMPQLFDMFQRRFEGKVRFGITSFVDKFHPDTNWAHDDDYCVRLHMPLTDVSDPAAMQTAMETFENLEIYGGNDYHDGANEGMLRAALSDSVGWRELTHDPVTGRPILRLLILATDAALHEAGYAQELYELNPPLPANNLVANPSIIADDIDAQCQAMDFPTGDDIATALASRNIIPIIFSGNPKQTGYDRIWAQYKKEWVRRFDQYGWWDDLELGLVRYYADYFSDVVKRDTIVQLIDETSSNFVEVFEEAMAQVTHLTCIPPAVSTTEEPSTVPTTTEESTAVETSTVAPTTTEDSTTEEPTTVATSTIVPTTTEASTTELVITTTEESTTVESTTIEPSTVESTSTEEATTKTDDSQTAPQPTTEEVVVSTTEEEVPIIPEEPEITEGVATDKPTAAPTTPAAAESTTTEEEAGGSNAAIIGSAAGGGGVVAVAAALAAAKKMGFLFNGSSAPDLNITTDVETPEVTADREQFEAVTGDLFA